MLDWHSDTPAHCLQQSSWTVSPPTSCSRVMTAYLVTTRPQRQIQSLKAPPRHHVDLADGAGPARIEPPAADAGPTHDRRLGRRIAADRDRAAILWRHHGP